ncbi:MAG: hypothetical protein GF311_07495 [Candidatus Lokiarchaeota archaeon]|nr:hypothetical protein [Candidatus Lokiarchaeota archaeon]
MISARNSADLKEELEKEAEQILEMADGFGLLCQDPQESDKKAFISGYVEYRLTH